MLKTEDGRIALNPGTRIVISGTDNAYVIDRYLEAGGQALLYQCHLEGYVGGQRYLLKEYYPPSAVRIGDCLKEGVLMQITERTLDQYWSRCKAAEERAEQFRNGSIHGIFTPQILDCNDSRMVTVMNMASDDCISIKQLLEKWEVVPPVVEGFNESFSRIKESAKIIKDVLRALDALHGTGVIHRDINPGNILIALSRIGKDIKYIPFLIDFSCCEKMGAQFEEDISVSPGYSHPLLKENSYLIDLYSVAALLLVLCTGSACLKWKRSWTVADLVSDNHIRIYKALEDCDIPLGVKNVLASILVKAVSMDPKKQYASAAKMYEDIVTLEEVIEQKGLHPATLFDSSAKEFGRLCNSESGVFRYQVDRDLLAVAVDSQSKEPVDLLKQNTILIGAGGAGKTTYIRELYGKCLETWERDPPNNPIPVYIPLNTFERDTPNWDSYIRDYILDTHFPGISLYVQDPRDALMGMLKSRGKYVFFLDAINEAVGNDRLNAEIAKDFAAIENVTVLITSRNDWGNDKTRKLFSIAELLPLNDEVIESKLRSEGCGTISTRLRQTLRRPMFLTMYLKLKITEKAVETPGEILYLYHKYLIDEFSKGFHADEQDAFEMILNKILPEMASSIGSMSFDSEQVCGVVKTIQFKSTKQRGIAEELRENKLTEKTLAVLRNCGLIRKYREDVEGVEYFTYAHQSYQEFYQAFSVVRQLMNDPKKSALPFCLSSDILTSEVIGFLCELWKPVRSECEYPSSLELTIKQWLCQHLAGKQGGEAQIAVQNLIEVLKWENNRQLLNFSFDGLDLRATNFYQCNISGSTFRNAIVSEEAFVSSGHHYGISLLEIAPKKQRIVTGTENESKVIVWNIKSGKPLFDIDVEKTVVEMAISSDEELLAVCCGSTDDCWIKIYSLEDGRKISATKCKCFPLYMFFFMKGEHSLLLDDMGHGIARCDIMADELLINMVRMDSNWFDYATHSPNGEFFLISFVLRDESEKKHIVKIYSVHGCVAMFEYHNDEPIYFLFTPDGNLILGKTKMQYGVLPNLHTYDLLKKEYSTERTSLIHSIDAVSNRYLWSSYDCYDLWNNAETDSFFGYGGLVALREAYIASDGKMVVIVENGTEVFVYDHDTAALQKHFSASTHGMKPYQIPAEVHYVNDHLLMRVDPRGKVTCLDTEHQIVTRLFDIQSSWECKQCEEPEYVLRDIFLWRDFRHTIELWHIAENRCIATVPGGLMGVSWASYQEKTERLIIVEERWDTKLKKRCFERVKFYTVPECGHSPYSPVLPDYQYHWEEHGVPILDYLVVQEKIILAKTNGDIQIVRANGGCEVFEHIHAAPIDDLFTIHSREYFLTSSTDGQFIMWKSDTLQHWDVSNEDLDWSKAMGTIFSSPMLLTKESDEDVVCKKEYASEEKLYWWAASEYRSPDCQWGADGNLTAIRDTTLSVRCNAGEELLVELTRDSNDARICSFSLSPKGDRLAIITEIGKTEIYDFSGKPVLTWDVLDVEDVYRCNFTEAELMGSEAFRQQLLINGAILDFSKNNVNN